MARTELAWAERGSLILLLGGWGGEDGVVINAAQSCSSSRRRSQPGRLPYRQAFFSSRSPRKSAGWNARLLRAKPAPRQLLVGVKRAGARCKEPQRDKSQTRWAPHGLKKKKKKWNNCIGQDLASSMVWLIFKMKITFLDYYTEEKFPPWQWQLIFSALMANRRNIPTPSPWQFKTENQNGIGKSLYTNGVAWRASDFWRS